MFIPEIRKTVFFIAILVAISTYFLTDNYVKKLQERLSNEVQLKLKINSAIYNLHINFLRSRKAEKNLLLFKDYQYKNELDSSINATQRYCGELDQLIRNPKDRELFYPIQKNIEDYITLVDKMSALVLEGRAKEDEITAFSSGLRELNDALADNIMYLSDKNNTDIQSALVEIASVFSALKSLPATILVISSVVMLMIAVWGVRICQRQSL
jgi:hypothetical protein